MFKSSYQSGFLSLLYSIGSKPLSIWSSEGVRGGAVAADEQAGWCCPIQAHFGIWKLTSCILCSPCSGEWSHQAHKG